ncbi:MAG: histidine kinase [Spirochaetia bacterium]|nr:histidine kinase [Spirochaetia bacterium]
MVNILNSRKFYNLTVIIVIGASVLFFTRSSYKNIEMIIQQSDGLNKIYENWLAIKTETVKYTLTYPKTPYSLIDSVSAYEISIENIINISRNHYYSRDFLNGEFEKLILMWQDIQFKLIKALFFNQDIGFFANEIIGFMINGTDDFEVQLKLFQDVINQYINKRVKLNLILFILGTSLVILLLILLGNLAIRYFKVSEEKQKIKELSKSLINIRDQERTRIAADLHDEIVQNLLYSCLLADGILQENQYQLPYKISERIDKLKAEIHKNIMLVRNIAFNLRPPELIDGLKKSIEYFLSDIEMRTKISTEFLFLCNDDFVIEQDIEIMVYRLVYEAVNNSVKHSKASKIIVKIIPVYPNILIRVEDNGVGFINDTVNAVEHMGLKGMEGRVKFINGSMKIISEVGHGTILIFTVPSRSKYSDEKV